MPGERKLHQKEVKYHEAIYSITLTNIWRKTVELEREVERLKAQLQTRNAEPAMVDAEVPLDDQHLAEVNMELTESFNHTGDFLQAGHTNFHITNSTNDRNFASPRGYSSPNNAVENIMGLGGRSDDLSPQVSNTEALTVQLDDIVLSSEAVSSLFHM
jgi:hypothetical protein